MLPENITLTSLYLSCAFLNLHQMSMTANYEIGCALSAGDLMRVFELTNQVTASSYSAGHKKILGGLLPTLIC